MMSKTSGSLVQSWLFWECDSVGDVGGALSYLSVEMGRCGGQKWELALELKVMEHPQKNPF